MNAHHFVSPESANRMLRLRASGGGLDYHLTKRISIKPIQVEYLMTQINSTKGFGGHQNDIRYSGGVAFSFGEK